jgi:hypothetical protein
VYSFKGEPKPDNARVYDIECLQSACHDLHVVLVNILEAFGLLGQLLNNVATCATQRIVVARPGKLSNDHGARQIWANTSVSQASQVSPEKTASMYIHCENSNR